MWGVTLNIYWGAAEPVPRVYSWGAIRPALALARKAGLRLQPNFCFHAGPRQPLPRWVLREGEECPDIFFTDRAGERCRECLTLGVDDGERWLGHTAGGHA